MNEKPPYLDDEDWEEVQQRLRSEHRAKSSNTQEPPPHPGDEPPIGEAADSNASGAEDEGVRLEDFVAYMQTHDYIFKPAGDFWPAARINARLPKVKLFDGSGQLVIDEDTGEQKEIKPSVWLASHAAVEQMTWAPGLPQLIEDKLINEGGWIDRKGVTVFNLYRPPRPPHGDAAKAGRWIELVKKVYPDDADHIILFVAHRVQKPHEKINHGLLLIGVPGIGKDTMLEPVKYAVGPWNFAEVSPSQVLGRFNGHLKSVVLRISEITDMPEYDRYKFYSHMKTILAAPPDAHRVDEKNLREHYVVNVCGGIMLTNEKTGVYLPADDRRTYVARSEVKPADFLTGYWKDIWRWYEDGGYGHVAAYLAALDLKGFNPKTPPPKTAAFWAIVDANRPSEDAELADAIDELARLRLRRPSGDNGPVKTTERPAALTIAEILYAGNPDAGLADWLRDRKNRRNIPHRLERCGYAPVRNSYADDGLFVIDGRRQVVYGRNDLSPSEKLMAAERFVNEKNK